MLKGYDFKIKLFFFSWRTFGQSTHKNFGITFIKWLNCISHFVANATLGGVGWSAMCDCGITRSYSRTFIRQTCSVNDI